MTQIELVELLDMQSRRYGEPSTLRAIIRYLRNVAPEAVPILEQVAERRAALYREHRDFFHGDIR